MQLLDDLKARLGFGVEEDDEEEGAESSFTEEGGDDEEFAEESKLEAIISTLKENKVAVIIAGIGIVVLVLIILGLSVHKTKVDAVLSEQEQGELIDSISEQLSTLESNTVTKDEADEIASAVVEDNFSDLLITNMKGYSQDEIVEIVRPTIESYLRDNDIELSEAEIKEITETVSKSIKDENDKLQKDVDKLRSDVKALQDAQKDNKNGKDGKDGKTPSSSSKTPDKNYDTQLRDMNSAINTNKTGVANNKSSITSMKKDIDNIEKDIDDLNKKVKTTVVSTTMIEYIFKGDNSNWLAENKTHKSSSMDTAEFCAALMGNDKEMRTAINNLKTQMDKKVSDIDKKISSTEDRIKAYDNRIKSLEDLVTKYEERITKLEEAIDNVDDNTQYIDPYTGAIYVMRKGKALIFDVDTTRDYEDDSSNIPSYVYKPGDRLKNNPIPVDPASKYQDDPSKWYQDYINGRSASLRSASFDDFEDEVDEEESAHEKGGRKLKKDTISGNDAPDAVQGGEHDSYKEEPATEEPATEEPATEEPIEAPAEKTEPAKTVEEPAEQDTVSENAAD